MTNHTLFIPADEYMQLCNSHIIQAVPIILGYKATLFAIKHPFQASHVTHL